MFGVLLIIVAMFRRVPPIAFPIEISDFLQMLKWLRYPVTQSSTHPYDALAAFEKRFAAAFNLSHCISTSSGRAALTLALSALKEIASVSGQNNKADVIIPAYTCPTVALSVARAGLKVKLCDISLETLNIDVFPLEKLVDENTLCVVAAHMFGFPCDMERILKIVRANEIFLIEDVAQAAGAKWKGQMLGGLGHLSCFSLGRGKSITTYEGGVLGVSNAFSSYAPSLPCLLASSSASGIQHPASKTVHSLRMLIQLLLMSFLQGARAWWFISRLPIGFEQQYHSIDFRIERLENWQAAFGLSVLQRIESINSARVRNGRYLAQQLSCLKMIAIPQALNGAEPVYLRLPVIFKESQLREEIYRSLLQAGVGVSKMYVSSLNRYHYLADIVPDGHYPSAEQAADRILALPTHPLMEERDLQTIVRVFRSALDV
jgi:perosamine synthetase